MVAMKEGQVALGISKQPSMQPWEFRFDPPSLQSPESLCQFKAFPNSLSLICVAAFHHDKLFCYAGPEYRGGARRGIQYHLPAAMHAGAV